MAQSTQQSVTYRYREFPVPGIFHFFSGIGTGIGTSWYRKKVSEPVSVKFGTGKRVSEPVLEKFGTGKSTGIGIENILHWKKVSVSVSSNILGTVTHCEIVKGVKSSDSL